MELPSTSQNTNGNKMSKYYQPATWRGILQWYPKNSMKGDSYQAPCQILAISKAEDEFYTMINTLPHTLHMQFSPITIVKEACLNYSESYRTAFYYPRPCEALKSLAQHMNCGSVGIVHTPSPKMSQSASKVMLLFYVGEKSAYLAFVPNNQADFVKQLIKVVENSKPNPALYFQVHIQRQPKSLLALSSHALGALIANSALDVLKKCRAPRRSVYAKENRKYPDLLVVLAAEFFDDLIPQHLHEVVTQHSLACIAFIKKDIFQNDYNILDIFLRSHIKKFDFPSEIYNCLHSYGRLEQ